MIAYLHGQLASLDPAQAIVECGGVGYLAKISLYTYEDLKGKKEILLHTYFHVREDAQVLFGFSAKQERSLFEQLISISGVGGNTALAILSSLSSAELVLAIRSEDVGTLKAVKGIGPKTAGRIVLELRDKIDSTSDSVPSAKGRLPGSNKKQEALAALLSLGMPKSAMATRIDKIIHDSGPEISVEQIIKQALRNP